jgi:hypothetical protein
VTISLQQPMLRMLLCAWTLKHQVAYWLLFHKTLLTD